jgi:hypothetical protein
MTTGVIQNHVFFRRPDANFGHFHVRTVISFMYAPLRSKISLTMPPTVPPPKIPILRILVDNDDMDDYRCMDGGGLKVHIKEGAMNVSFQPIENKTPNRAIEL